jgi:hypothetical protein
VGLLSGAKGALGYDSESDRDAAMSALQDAAAGYSRISLPELERLILQNPQWLRDLEASTIDVGPDIQYQDVATERAGMAAVDGTAMNDIAVDPRLKDQQLASLSALQELAEGGGMNAADQANLARIQNQVSQADRGRREAVMQGMQRRGMSGSGMDLLAQLQSSQAATDRASAEGLNVAGMAQDRALRALMEGGNLAGSIRGQDFGEQSQVAQARDAIAKFNAQNTIQNNQFNAGQGNSMAQFNAGNQLNTALANRDNRQNTAKFNAGQMQNANQFNVGGAQSVANTGAQYQNQAAQYNVGREQQQFQNKMAKAGGNAQAQQALAAQHNANAAATDAEFGQDVATVATIAAMASDKRAKKGVKKAADVDLDHFLATLNAKQSWEYKDPKHGDGKRVGPMAQDLLKSKLGAETVVQMEGGMLGYDKDKMQGVILAALKHLSDKIDKKGS